MMNMEKKKLGEIATYVNGYAFKPTDWRESGIPIIRIQDLTGLSYQLNYYDGDYPEKIEINNGDVLISWSASLGVYIWERGKALLNQHIFKVVFDKEEIVKEYFVYAVKFNLKTILLHMHGATMKHIVKKDFDNIEIPYPSIERQKEVSKVLSKVEALISKRKQQLDALDNLIKSRFVEMFGDKIDSTAKELKDLCMKITDGTHQSPQFVQDGIPFIFVSNIQDFKINYDTEKYISKETYDGLTRKTPIDIGDVLLTIVGSYGNPAVVESEKKFCFQRHIAHLKPKRELVNSYYLHTTLRVPYVRKQIDQKVKGIAQKTLNLSELNKIKVNVPDLKKQNKFVSFAHQVDKLKVEIQKSLNESKMLFDSLMQKYFG